AAREELERVEPRRERGERPLALEEELREAVALVGVTVVGDVLADALLTPADQVDDRRLARELAGDRERQELGLDRVDLDPQLADVVVEHGPEPSRTRRGRRTVGW